MDLIERDLFLTSLQTAFHNIEGGEGHCIFVSGEAGMGKTSLIKTFCKQQKKDCHVYQGSCDALFTPRLLAPLYDILWQVNNDLWPKSQTIEERTQLFAELFRELSNKKQKILIIFEDIHWADEATLDFIKFLARRIIQLPCLFILTYRDDEIHSYHPLRTMMGQLNPDSFSLIKLLPLSKQAVEKMAAEKGYSGSAIYAISGGNPFYVTEILASYSPGVPDKVRDSILSVYNRKQERTRNVWDLLSAFPGALELNFLERMEPSYLEAIEDCVNARILILDKGQIFFKHELYRRTIETSLSPLKRVSLNKRVLDILGQSFEQSQQIERIIHHAKNANEYEIVVRYAPLAAMHAASVGSHTEAARLYLTAIEYYQGNDNNTLIQFYELYAYECYLTNQVKEAIIYTGKALIIWKEKNDAEKIANCMRFLSRLWWLDGNTKNAKKFAEEAIEVLSNQPSSSTKAMTFSNMSQLKMLLDRPAESIAWGEKAITIAKEMHDEKTLSHALNNVGSVYMNIQSSDQKGIELLQQSLKIALKNSFHEHAARAYSNLGSNGLKRKNYAFAEKILDEGIKYCEERDLDSSRAIMLSLKCVLDLETGDWQKASSIAEHLLKNENHLSAFTIVLLTVSATIKVRTGDTGALPLLLEAATKAFETSELQRIIPSLTALLEYEWIMGKVVIKSEDLERSKSMLEQSIYNIEKNEFAFWLQKARKQHLQLNEVYEGYDVSSVKNAQKAASIWEKIGYTYGQALTLFEGDVDDKKKAIKIVQALGANAVYEKMKLEMRASGIKSIPRGVRKTTQLNPGLLTNRELDVFNLLHKGLQNKEIASKLFISAKTVDHHISAILFKLDVNSRIKAVQKGIKLEIIK